MEDRLLHIRHLYVEPVWVHQILRQLDNELREKYSKSKIVNWQRSIAIKKAILINLIANINKRCKEINDIFKAKMTDAEICLNEGKAFPLNDGDSYDLLASMEAFISALQSLMEVMYTYVHVFYEDILGETKRKTEIREELKCGNIDVNWEKDLNNLRDDILHNYSTWIAFEKKTGGFYPVLLLPKSLDKYGRLYKKYKRDYLTVADFNHMMKMHNDFFEKLIDFLLKKIDAYLQS